MHGPARDLRQHILDRLNATPDRAWTPTDFLDIGPRAAVDKALQRLVAAGDLRWIDRGLYDRPHVSQLTGALTAPDRSAVADAIARRDRARLVVDGMMAANDLGLTTDRKIAPARSLTTNLPLPADWLRIQKAMNLYAGRGVSRVSNLRLLQRV